MPSLLFIDDDYASLTIFEIVSRQANCTYYGVQNNTQLIKWMESGVDVDLIFTDLKMPYVNGYQVLEEFRRMPEFNHVPILGISAHHEEISTVRSAGFNGFIKKPISIPRFIAQINSLLKGNIIWE